MYDNGLLDSVYNVMQLITQSLRSLAGKTFENIIEKIFQMNGIHYKKQVKMPDGYIVDFIVYNSDNTIAEIISCKTTLRERKLQDKYLLSIAPITYITMDIVNGSNNTISVNADTQNLTKYIEKLKNHTLFSIYFADLEDLHKD